jgi:hypothetical protein
MPPSTPRLPEPTGRQPVGMTSLYLKDLSRPDPWVYRSIRRGTSTRRRPLRWTGVRSRVEPTGLFRGDVLDPAYR